MAPRDAPAALDEARRRIRELEEQARVWVSVGGAIISHPPTIVEIFQSSCMFHHTQESFSSQVSAMPLTLSQRKIFSLDAGFSLPLTMFDIGRPQLRAAGEARDANASVARALQDEFKRHRAQHAKVLLGGSALWIEWNRCVVWRDMRVG